MPKDRPPNPLDLEMFASEDELEAMNALELGAFVRLSWRSWRRDPACSLPLDHGVLAAWARVSPDVWPSVSPRVLAPFTLRSGGLLVNPRAQEAFGRLQKSGQRRSAAGAAAASARWGHSGRSPPEPGNEMRPACDSHAGRRAPASSPPAPSLSAERSEFGSAPAPKRSPSTRRKPMPGAPAPLNPPRARASDALQSAVTTGQSAEARAPAGEHAGAVGGPVVPPAPEGLPDVATAAPLWGGSMRSRELLAEAEFPWAEESRRRVHPHLAVRLVQNPLATPLRVAYAIQRAREDRPESPPGWIVKAVEEGWHVPESFRHQFEEGERWRLEALAVRAKVEGMRQSQARVRQAQAPADRGEHRGRRAR